MTIFLFFSFKYASCLIIFCRTGVCSLLALLVVERAFFSTIVRIGFFWVVFCVNFSICEVSSVAMPIVVKICVVGSIVVVKVFCHHWSAPS